MDEQGMSVRLMSTGNVIYGKFLFPPSRFEECVSCRKA